MVTDKEAKEINGKLDTVIKLLAGIMLKGMALGDKIAVLKELGFERKDIAALSGTTPATVTAYLYDQKTGKKGRKKAGKNAET